MARPFGCEGAGGCTAGAGLTTSCFHHLGETSILHTMHRRSGSSLSGLAIRTSASGDCASLGGATVELRELRPPAAVVVETRRLGALATTDTALFVISSR